MNRSQSWIEKRRGKYERNAGKIPDKIHKTLRYENKDDMFSALASGNPNIVKESKEPLKRGLSIFTSETLHSLVPL